MAWGSPSLPAAELAKVGDVSIGTDRVKAAVLRGGHNVYTLEGARAALDDVVNFELMAAAARKAGLDRDPVLAEQIQQLLVERLIAREVDEPLRQAEPTEAELKAYYDQHAGEFRQPAFARGLTLTLLPAGGGDVAAGLAAAEQRAREALGKIQAGEKFEDVVARYSDDPGERVNRGSSGWFAEGKSNKRYADEAVQALFGLPKAGDVAGPIRTARAVYLVQLQEKRPPVVTPFEQARPQIAKAVQLQKRQRAQAALVERLKREFPVTVHEAALPSVVEPMRPGSGPPRGPVPLPPPSRP
jgi:peptidyl-prolyl cis-trans isomerase C